MTCESRVANALSGLDDLSDTIFKTIGILKEVDSQFDAKMFFMKDEIDIEIESLKIELDECRILSDDGNSLFIPDFYEIMNNTDTRLIESVKLLKVQHSAVQRILDKLDFSVESPEMSLNALKDKLDDYRNVLHDGLDKLSQSLKKSPAQKSRSFFLGKLETVNRQQLTEQHQQLLQDCESHMARYKKQLNLLQFNASTLYIDFNCGSEFLRSCLQSESYVSALECDNSAVVRCVVLLTNGYLLTGSRDLVQAWTLSPTKCLFSFKPDEGTVKRALELEAGSIASLSSTDKVIIWDFETRVVLLSIASTGLANIFLRNGQLLTTSTHNEVNLWNPSTGQRLTSQSISSYSGKCMVELENGDIAFGYWGNRILVWDLALGITKYTLENEELTNVSSLLELTESNQLLSGSLDGSLHLWNLTTRSHECKLTTAHSNAITCLIKTKNGLVLSGSHDASIKVWDLTTRKCITTLTGHERVVECLLEVEPGVILSAGDGSIKIWNLNFYGE